MSTKKISHKAPQWGSLTVLGTLVVAPLLSAPDTAEAAPVRYAQAGRQVVTVTGVVTRDLSGREFRMRSNDGREFRVIIDVGREPRVLSRGDRVQVRGYFTSGLFIANSLSILSNVGRPGYNVGRPYYGGGRPGYAGRPGQTISLTGVVTRDLSGREFRMRSNDGREFRVIIDVGREPRVLSRGDRVTVNGYFSSGLFIANSLTLVNNYGGTRNRPGYYGGNRPYYGGTNRPYYGGNRPGYYGGPTRGQTISVTGVVTRDLAGREFRMRSANGREFRVIIDAGREPRALSNGDRVRVNGYFTSGLFIAHNLVILNNQGGWGNRPGSYPQGYPRYPQGYPQGGYTRPGNGQITFTGTVANIDSSTKLWVRAYNGTTYEVVTSVPLSPAISEGDIVRVSGWGSAQSLQAGRVVLVRNIR